MDYKISRLRYFNGQFLLGKDFTDQQDYHIDQSKVHDRTTRVWGIAEGLSVAEKAGSSTKVTVQPGAAIDGDGNLILLSLAKDADGQDAEVGGQPHYLVIVFHEDPDVMASGQYVSGNTRMTQKPTLSFVPVPKLKPGQVVLAKMDVDVGGAVSNIDPSFRTNAGARFPGANGNGFDVRSRPDTQPAGKLTIERFTPNDAAMTPLVTVDSAGSMGVGTTAPVAKLDVSQNRSASGHPASVKGLYVTGDLGPDSDGVEFRRTDGTQGLGFGYNTVYAAGSAADQSIGLKPKGTGTVNVTGALEVTGRIHSSSGGIKFPDNTTQTTAAFLPTGLIVMWSGSAATIPPGWALCNGQNGTPDLHDRFIVGAGVNYSPGDTGGANAVGLSTNQMPSHSHGGSVWGDGDHRHMIPIDQGPGNGLGWASPNAIQASTAYFDNSGYPGIWAVIDSWAWTEWAGSHSHGINAEGGGQAHENRPPYYALCFIMKL